MFARDEILAIVSHDLRNPLGVVQMDAAELKTWEIPGDKDISSKLRVSADRILRSVGLMSRLIADLLDMAKIDAGRLDLRKQPEASRALIEDVLSILEPLANAKQITIEKELTEAPPVNADRDRIFYVLSNIIGNAIKFTPERGTITLRTEWRRDELLIIVDDSGPGIPPDAARPRVRPLPARPLQSRRHRPRTLHRQRNRPRARRKHLGRGCGRRRIEVLSYTAPCHPRVAGAPPDRGRSAFPHDGPQVGRNTAPRADYPLYGAPLFIAAIPGARHFRHAVSMAGVYSGSWTRAVSTKHSSHTSYIDALMPMPWCLG